MAGVRLAKAGLTGTRSAWAVLAVVGLAGNGWGCPGWAWLRLSWLGLAWLRLDLAWLEGPAVLSEPGVSIAEAGIAGIFTVLT